MRLAAWRTLSAAAGGWPRLLAVGSALACGWPLVHDASAQGSAAGPAAEPSAAVAAPGGRYVLGRIPVRLGPPRVLGLELRVADRVRVRPSASPGPRAPEAPASPALVQDWSLRLPRARAGTVEVVTRLELDAGEVAGAILPGLDGRVRRVALAQDGVWPARYVLGRGAAGPAGGTALALPALGLELKTGRTLGLALDPYCGAAFQPLRTGDGRLAVELTTVYAGSESLVERETRTAAATAARDPLDAIFAAFYSTIPDIRPGPVWLRGIRLVYYDYLSDGGEGWFRDIDELARRIPERPGRGKVLLCLHGWYDYLGRYAFDTRRGRLDREWTAFPGSRKIPMSVPGLRRRLDYARERGFRAVLYFADGLLADDRAPGFDPARVYVDAAGRTEFPVWRGPDTLGTNRYQDPSHPAVRRHYLDYLRALIREFGPHTDGFVWDETFYIRREWVSRRRPEAPAPADRAMMTLAAELVRTTQKLGEGRLAFLVSDAQGADAYGLREPPAPNALVAHGTFQDTAGDPRAWPASFLPNHRNALFSCMWEPVKHAEWNRINCERWGQPQALSNGWGDDEGPAEMARNHPELLAEVLRRFHTGAVPVRPNPLGE